MDTLVLTVGDLQDLLAKYPRERRLIVRSYEGGFDDMYVVDKKVVLYGRQRRYLGPHDERDMFDDDDERKETPVLAFIDVGLVRT